MVLCTDGCEKSEQNTEGKYGNLYRGAMPQVVEYAYAVKDVGNTPGALEGGDDGNGLPRCEGDVEREYMTKKGKNSHGPNGDGLCDGDGTLSGVYGSGTVRYKLSTADACQYGVKKWISIG